MFIGRQEELKYLNDIYDSHQSEMIMMYGRRRIGKTELLKQFSNDKEHLYYSAKECTDYEQIGSFSRKILGEDARFQSWEALFTHLSNLALDKPYLVIIDEFPYVVKANASVASILQNLWDHQLKNTQIKIVLCGSSMSFIEKSILSEKNPLYGRMTGIYKLEELKFRDISGFFPSYSEEELVYVYGILGGVPHYLLQFDPNKSIHENIISSILNKGRVLFNEVDFLIKQELREPMVYYTIIEKIAMGATKLNEIHQKTQIETNKLAVYLKNLISLGIVIKEYPITEKLKKKINLHSGIYKIKTNYFKFYFKFVFPNISNIEEGFLDDVYEFDIEPNLNEYMGLIYEQICTEVLKEYIYQHKEPFRIRSIGRWWNKNHEIDIVGLNGDDYIFAECKWRKQKCSVKHLNDLIQKIDDNFRYVNKHVYIFSKSGFTDDLTEAVKNNREVQLVKMMSLESRL